VSTPSISQGVVDASICECSQLTTVILGEGLEEIGKHAFGRCTSLYDISIPPAVKSIKDGAFLQCSR
jgi:hypothetical protein